MARLLVALFCFITIPRVLVGQADTARADTVPFGVRLSFATPSLNLKEPEQLRAPWLGAERLSPLLRGFAWDSTVSAVLDSTRRERSVSQRLLTLYGEPLQPLPSEEAEAPQQDKGALGLSKKYADLAMDGQVRLEIRTDRLKNERCAPALLLDPNSGCQGGFKPPRLDNQVNVRSGGVIGERVHLAVDYDTERDFSANNNIQVYYQGLEDEIVRRIEVGTVTFQPPQSRFITAAIPANNFGVNARFEVGPLQFQTLAATQKGSQVAERVYTIGQTTSQPQDRQLRDLDFETGRFFWVVDPTTAIPNYPAIDILNLSTAGLAPAVQPVQVRVYRYRPPQTESGADPNLGGITALARTIDPAQSFGPVRWQLLIQGTDYYIDPSGLWFALATKLDQNDYLAVSYTTAAGTTVGSFPAEDQGQGSSDSLRLIVEPKTGPQAVTFRHEMRQIYRAAGADLDRSSLLVNLSVNRSERPQGQASTYLALLGLASSTDQNVFDRDNRLFPRPRDPDASEVLKESYIIFPTLTPFADPRLSSAERSDSLYRTPLYLLLSQGPPARFQVRLRYNSSGAGDRSTLSLGALQIREGSEQLLLGGRHLERGTDYTISYELGQVTFLNPDALFGTGTGQITARFEEQGIFAVAPTTILGMATTYNLGEVGAVNLIGMYQREQSAFNRPPLGFEASANLIGGVNTALHFKPSGVSHFLSQLTSKPAVAPSLLDVNAEFAFTKPDQNRSGQAYVEEFEAEAGIPLSLQENVWEFGSQPQRADGVEDIGFAGGFLPEDAVALTWQNLIPQPGTNQPVELRAQDIDTLIRIAGQAEQQETALYLTLHADTAGGVVKQNNASRWSQPERLGRPRWRSMVTPLSPTGLDLTRDEYLEFWVFQDPATRTAEAAGVRLVFDLGTVNEDALGIGPDSIAINGSDTTYSGRQYVGLGRLDTERSNIDIFDAQVADTGILGDRPDVLVDATTGGQVRNLPLCQRELSTAVPVFPWGDLSGRCTNGNGALDTEDLNGDNVLNATGSNENVFRYIVSLAPGDKYYVRNGRVLSNGSPSGWQLYRIPIRAPDDTIGTPNLRLIQHLRMTVVAPPDPSQPDVVAKFAMARLRLVGSPWVRRAETPIAGLSGSLGEPTGEVIASIISTENQTDLGYEPPPGVFEGATRRGIDRATLGTQINEKSLRLIGRGLEPGDRAEAYLRFPAGPQNMLSYRTLRVWMRGRGTEWEAGEYQAFIKLGSDDRNFYLYRAPARSTTWDPEFVIDLETWRNLRATLENRWLSGAPPSGAAECGGGDPNAYVICDGPYMVQLANPGINPPNLAAVQEVSAGIYRLAGSPAGPDAELWVDDIRLSGPVSDVGTAIAVDTRFIASDVGSVNASFIRRDGQFHQINSDPTYRTTGAFVLGTNWRLDRFLPTSLGLAIPFSVSYNRANVDPQLLTGTDIRGDALSGLRTPVSWTANYSLSIRRSQRGRGWLSRGLLDPLSLIGNLTQGRARTELSDANSNAYTGLLGYNLQLNRHGFSLPFSGIAKRLPKWLRESEAGKALRDAEFNLVPSNIRWSSGLTKDRADYSLFSIPVTRPEDELIQPTVSLTHIWRNTGGLTWQPLGMLSLNSDITSTRDLRVYPDSTSLGRLAYAEREFFLGIPVGVERDRTVSTALALTPRISSWLRPRYSTSSNFLLSRTLTSRAPIQEDGDSGAFILPQTLNNSRSRDIGVSVDLARLLHQVSGDSGGVGKAFARVRPIDYTTRLARGSTYDLNVFEPDLGFMLGFGGLDDFLSHEGETARGATETRSSTLSSGADLPLGFTATISYSLTKTDRFQLVADGFSETSSRQREWPVGSLRWTRAFTRGPITLLAAGAAVRQREGTSTQPGGFGGSRSATSSSTFTPDLQLSFRNGLALTASLSTRSQRTENNGNATLLDQDDITGSLNYAFALPAALSRTRKRVRSTVTALSSKTVTCLEQGFNPECTVVSDVRRQEIRGGLDTDLLKTVTGGLQFGYSINDARHLSRRTSQIFVLLSLQLSLYAGDYR